MKIIRRQIRKLISIKFVCMESDDYRIALDCGVLQWSFDENAVSWMRHFRYNAFLSLLKDTSWGKHVACISITFQKFGLELTFWSKIESIHPAECDTCKWFQVSASLKDEKGYDCLHDWEWCIFICVNAVAVDISFHPRSWFVFVSIANRTFLGQCRWVSPQSILNKTWSNFQEAHVKVFPWYSFPYTRTREDDGTTGHFRSSLIPTWECHIYRFALLSSSRTRTGSPYESREAPLAESS